MPRVSLLSVVKEKNGTRYMAVDQIHGIWADCAWLEQGVRKTKRVPLDALEVVPAPGPDDQKWREAFSAAAHHRIG